jgi:hypothetical protein
MGVSPVIAPNHRVAVVGMTGSGKSLATGFYLAGYQNVIALDSKGDSEGKDGLKKFWPALLQIGQPPAIFTRLKDLVKFGAGRAIYRPEPGEMDFSYYEAFYRWIYDRKNTIVWTDEVYSVCDGQELPFHYKAIFTRGRSRQVGSWNCTQRPKFVPNFLFSEAEHILQFRLQLETDRDKMAGTCGKEVMDNPPGEHGFWYFRSGTQRPILVPEGLQLNL